MDLRDSEDGAAFRARLRDWLATNLPTKPEPKDFHGRWEYMRSFQRKLYEGGLVALSYPTDVGGQGLGAVEEAIFSEELALAGAPPILPLGHLGRPFLTHASEAQRVRYLPRLLATEDIWCQGFSEPDAGSDLASLKARATPDGDGYRISGQKVWTSYGVFADYCLLLARTADTKPQHRGISAFVLPLDTEGVTLRPIVLANGDQEFAEIFLDDVFVPGENMIGQAGDGWAIAMVTITAERGAVDIGYLPKFERFFSELATEVCEHPEGASALDRERLGRIAASLEVLRFHSLRRLSERAAGAEAGPESSIDKLLMTRVEQEMLSAAMELSRDHESPHRAEWFSRYLYARAGSIYGGSSQIQRNILAQRVLGLPR